MMCILTVTPLHCPAYLYKEASFHKPCIDPLKRLEWWREVGTDSGGHVLAVSYDHGLLLVHIAQPALDSWNQIILCFAI
jgi:hypothetical protein